MRLHYPHATHSTDFDMAKPDFPLEFPLPPAGHVACGCVALSHDDTVRGGRAILGLRPRHPAECPSWLGPLVQERSMRASMQPGATILHDEGQVAKGTGHLVCAPIDARAAKQNSVSAQVTCHAGVTPGLRASLQPHGGRGQAWRPSTFVPSHHHARGAF